MYRSWRCRCILSDRFGWVVDTNYSGSMLKVHWDNGFVSWVAEWVLEDISDDDDDDDEFVVEVK